MTAPTLRFTNRVANYVKYRPGYPEEVIDFLKDKAGLSPDSVIADVGAGTGIFTKLLLDKGYTVCAVEPNDAMRKSSEEQLGSYANFKAINGTAEATSLETNSVDLIVCAQAFHWFDQTLTKTEFRRILKPKGQVALIWNNRQVEYDEFAVAYEVLLMQQSTDYAEVNHRNLGDVDFTNFFKNGKYQVGKYQNIQVFDEEGLLGRAFSSSYIPPKDTDAGQNFQAKLQQLFEQYQVDNAVKFVYQTEIYLGKV